MEAKTKTPQPQTKAALKTMIMNYCEGKQSYGEPNTWDVSLVTDMSDLIKDVSVTRFAVDQFRHLDTRFVTESSFVTDIISGERLTR